jgi:hypothetical protein
MAICSAVSRIILSVAPDPSTVVFRLKFPSASLLTNLASPWNVIFPKKYLDEDPNYFKNNAIGSGPFKFKSYTRGSTFEGERNPDYFIKDRPYRNGYKFFISTETSVRAAAIRSGRAYIEFRDLPQAEVESIKKQLGDKVVVQSTPFVIERRPHQRPPPSLPSPVPMTSAPSPARWSDAGAVGTAESIRPSARCSATRPSGFGWRSTGSESRSLLAESSTSTLTTGCPRTLCNGRGSSP